MNFFDEIEGVTILAVAEHEPCTRTVWKRDTKCWTPVVIDDKLRSFTVSARGRKVTLRERLGANGSPIHDFEFSRADSVANPASPDKPGDPSWTLSFLPRLFPLLSQ